MLNSIANTDSGSGVIPDAASFSSTDGVASDPLHTAFADLLAELSPKDAAPTPAQIATTLTPNTSALLSNPKAEPTAKGNSQDETALSSAMTNLPDATSFLAELLNPNSGVGFTPARSDAKPADTPTNGKTDSSDTSARTNSQSVTENITQPMWIAWLPDNNPLQSAPNFAPQSGVDNPKVIAAGQTLTARVPFELPHPDAFANSIQVQSESMAVTPAQIPADRNPPSSFADLLKNLNPEGSQPAEKPPAGYLTEATDHVTTNLNSVDRPETESIGVNTPVSQEASVVPVAADLIKQTVTVGSKATTPDSREDHQKQTSDATPKGVAIVNTSITGATPRFENPTVSVESARPPSPVQEMPQLPLQMTAHNVSIDIGDKDSKVLVTLHERAGDVSVKVHAPNDLLKTELQSSVGTLVEALHRANVSLKNLDFTSGYGTTADTGGERNSPRADTPQLKGRRRSQSKDAADDSVHLRLLEIPQA